MAANFKACSVDDCNKIGNAGRGWCKAHYTRWHRYGDPLFRKAAANGEAQRYFHEVVLSYEGDECLIWPFSRDSSGYGLLHDENRKTKYVSRMVCEKAHGPEPTSKHEAAHSCGKGHEGCCTKGHLSWKTSAENHADKIIHGTSNRGERCGAAKLTEPEVRQILALIGIKPQAELATQFGVCRSTISAIHRKENWEWLL